MRCSDLLLLRAANGHSAESFLNGELPDLFSEVFYENLFEGGGNVNALRDEVFNVVMNDQFDHVRRCFVFGAASEEMPL